MNFRIDVVDSLVGAVGIGKMLRGCEVPGSLSHVGSVCFLLPIG